MRGNSWVTEKLSASQQALRYEVRRRAGKLAKTRTRPFSSRSHKIWRKLKQDRQWKYNATLRRVRVTTVPVERNKYYIFWVCVCSLSYPTCKTQALCCQLWPVWLYQIFRHYLINGKIFEKKKLLNIKCAFRFSLQFLSKTFLILRRI
jgi:hypothetical protein